jgi:hypothetical protein
MKLNDQTNSELARADKNMLACARVYTVAMIITAAAHILFLISWVTL